MKKRRKKMLNLNLSYLDVIFSKYIQQHKKMFFVRLPMLNQHIWKFSFTQNSNSTRTYQFPETKLSHQPDIGFDDYTLLHCVWECLIGPMKADFVRLV